MPCQHFCTLLFKFCACLSQPFSPWSQDGKRSCDWALKTGNSELTPAEEGFLKLYRNSASSWHSSVHFGTKQLLRLVLFCVHEISIKDGIRKWNTGISVLPLDSLIYLFLKKASVMPCVPQAILGSKAFLKWIQTKRVLWEARIHLLNICVINVISGRPNLLTSWFNFQ